MSVRDALSRAKSMLRTSEAARSFVEMYLTAMNSEQDHAQKCLHLSVDIVLDDLILQVQRKSDCRLLPALAHVFDRKKRFYNCASGKMTRRDSMPTVPRKVREIIIIHFPESNGFRNLHKYMDQKVGTPAFPHPSLVHHILTALADGLRIPPLTLKLKSDAALSETLKLDAIRILNTVM
jgi:hypothetical protein